VDTQNFNHVEELFKILSDEGFANKLNVYAAQIVGVNDFNSPSATYKNRCFTRREFADAESGFKTLAQRYGLSVISLPRPTATPCTAVRACVIIISG
jgi:hypothetical protein